MRWKPLGLSQSSSIHVWRWKEISIVILFRLSGTRWGSERKRTSLTIGFLYKPPCTRGDYDDVSVFVVNSLIKLSTSLWGLYFRPLGKKKFKKKFILDFVRPTSRLQSISTVISISPPGTRKHSSQLWVRVYPKTLRIISKPERLFRRTTHIRKF